MRERVHTLVTPDGSLSLAEINLLDVAKENMIGVVYEILPLAVINSERTWRLAGMIFGITLPFAKICNEFLQSFCNQTKHLAKKKKESRHSTYIDILL